LRSRFGKCFSRKENITDHNKNYGIQVIDIIGSGLWIIKAKNLRAFVKIKKKKKNLLMVNKPVS